MEDGRKGQYKFFDLLPGTDRQYILQDMLDQHPQLRCEGEIMQKKYLKPYRYIEGKSKIYKTKAYGFKVLPQQIRIQGFGNSTPFIHYLYNKGWKIIYVRRKNYIRQALSRLIGQQRGRNFRDQKAYNKAPNAKIDYKELKASLNGRYYFRKDEKKALTGLKYKEVIYERDLFDETNRKKCVSEIYHFLGVDPDFSPKTNFIRSTPEDLSKVIENYDEVLNMLEKLKENHLNNAS